MKKSYVKNLDKYKTKVKATVLEDFKDFYRNVLYEVATDTPVDTGRAQSSWWINQVGGMSRIVEGSGLPRDPSFYWMTWNNSNADLVNPNHYVVYLNEGWSSQAPAKFIERAISRAVRMS